MPVEFTLRFRTEPPSDAKARIHQALGDLLPDDLPRLEREFTRVQVQPAGNRALRVTLDLDDPALEHVAIWASSEVRRSLGRGPALE